MMGVWMVLSYLPGQNGALRGMTLGVERITRGERPARGRNQWEERKQAKRAFRMRYTDSDIATQILSNTHYLSMQQTLHKRHLV